MELARCLLGHERCSGNQCSANRNTRCCVVAANNQIPTFTIEDYGLYEVANVHSVGVQPRDNYGWDVAYQTDIKGPCEQYYFCIDGIYNETWPHWVSESAIYLVLFDKLKQFFPNLKLFVFTQKAYKMAMYKAFHIDDMDIVDTIDIAANKFLFPQYISLADHTHPFLYMKHMKNFYNYIVQKCPTQQKDIDILYLPRGRKENSKGTERTIPVQSALIELFEKMPGVHILYTDDTTNMIDQWDTVRRAKLIVLNEGGNHGINGFFAQGSKIIVLGGDGNGCHFQNPSPAFVYYDSIYRGNKYYHIPYDFPADWVMNFIMNVIQDQVKPIHTAHVNCWRKCLFCKYQEYSRHALIEKSIV